MLIYYNGKLAYIHVHSNACRMEYALAVWDVAQAELVTAWALTDYPSALEWHPHDPHQLVACEPDGTRLAYIQEGRVWLWTISTDGGAD